MTFVPLSNRERFAAVSDRDVVEQLSGEPLPGLGVVGELLTFLWKRRLYWLIPMIITLVVVALLLAAAGSGPLSPLVYTLF